jgi:hypothetical protein
MTAARRIVRSTEENNTTENVGGEALYETLAKAMVAAIANERKR